MGTTVTTNLQLIKPDINEKIKEDLPTWPGWADQNADNCDTIDALFRDDTNTYAGTWTALSVNPTLGSGGFVETKYWRLFPRMVVGHFRIFTGTAGFAAGTGLYKISVPFAVDPQLDGFNDSFVCGHAIMFDSDNVTTSQDMLVVYNVANDALYLRPSGGGSWNPTSPVTIAQSDRISGYFMYPTQAA